MNGPGGLPQRDKRIRSLEKMVYKTIENKQINSGAGSLIPDLPRNLTTSGDQRTQFFSVSTGAQDGDMPGDPARVGNSVTLMEQLVNMTFVQSSTDSYNRVRCIIAESVDGNQNLTLSDILEYRIWYLVVHILQNHQQIKDIKSIWIVPLN